MKLQKASLVKYSIVPSKALLVQCNEVKTIGENIILPAETDMVTTLLGVPNTKQLLSIPPSNNTLPCQTSDTAKDLNKKLVQR
jgi:hypothetical protein